MTASAPDLRLVKAAPRACWSPGCSASARGHCGLCGPCELVYRAALALHHALCARELARLEPGAPGISRVAQRVLVARLLELAPGRDLADADLFSQQPPVGGSPVIALPPERLDAFVRELAASGQGLERPP